MEPDKKRGMFLFGVSTVLVLAICKYSSYWVNATLDENVTMVLADLIFFTHVRNHGGIFGVAQGKGWIFALLAVLFLAGLVVFIWKEKHIRTFEYLCYGLIVGGGLGNVTDRLIYGSVIDFIEIRGISWWTYIFNTADVMIHAGIWPILIANILFPYDTKKNGVEETEAGVDSPAV